MIPQKVNWVMPQLSTTGWCTSDDMSIAKNESLNPKVLGN